jgi:hypothetical protein
MTSAATQASALVMLRVIENRVKAGPAPCSEAKAKIILQSMPTTHKIAASTPAQAKATPSAYGRRCVVSAHRRT